MKILVKEIKEVEVVKLNVLAKVRYWDDTDINGEKDTVDGDNIPCKKGDYWCPEIELSTGKILNWENGVSAEVHYKVCDCFTGHLLDSNEKIIASIENDYVPSIMCPKDAGYGDYIIMDIDEKGFIQNWKCDLTEWENIDNED